MGAPHFWGPCAGAPVAHAQGRAWARGVACCGASCVDRLYREVRPVTAGENGDESTNVSPGRPVGAGARRVVLGSAGHL